MAKYEISVINGDGIGPEVVAEGRKALAAIGAKCGHAFAFKEYLAGGCAIDATGVPLPDDTVKGVKDSHALLFGAIGGPKWENVAHHLKPEAGLLKLRKELDAWANLRPAVVYDELVDASTIKPEVLKGTDIMVLRELTGGIYFGEPRGLEDLPGGGRRGYNTQTYSSVEVERVARVAFELARKRGRKVCSIDKANVLESSILWREEVQALHDREFSDVALTHMYVDNCAMQLVRNPGSFDVLVTDNMFGDILSDEAAMLTGSLGMLPSASLGAPDATGRRRALYEPVHGSAPDIAGKGIANPLAAILSLAMALRYSFDLAAEADAVEAAVLGVLEGGLRTADIMEAGKARVSTAVMGEAVVRELDKRASL